MNLSITKLLTLTLITLVLSACSTMQTTFRPDTYVAVIPPQIEYPTFDIVAEVSLPTEILTVPERPVANATPRLLHERAKIAMTEAEIRCMSDVIYFESKSESTIGQIGVGYAVLNRMGHAAYPDTACGVAYDRRHGCQFSWNCGKAVKSHRHQALYETSRKIAIDVMEGRVANPIGESIQFRQKRLRAPRAMVLVAVIDNHSFYASRQ